MTKDEAWVLVRELINAEEKVVLAINGGYSDEALRLRQAVRDVASYRIIVELVAKGGAT